MTEPARVDVWFDPTCPWTWVTTRWLVEQVAPRRPLDLHWHQMSLAVLNEGKDLPPQYAERLAVGRRVGRLFTAVGQQQGEPALGPLYAAVGERLHRQGRAFDADLAREALAEAGLPADLAGALDDDGLDDAVRPSHEAGQEAVGEATGSPIVSLEGRAHFGPVLTAVPTGDDAVALFEALRALARSPQFSEVKRPRSGPPDVG